MKRNRSSLDVERSDDAGPDSHQDCLLEVRDVRVRFGGVTALADASLTLRHGSRTALLGPNGAGKSTLLGVVSGLCPTVAGDVRLEGRSIGGKRPDERQHIGIARTFQQPRLSDGLSAIENVLVAMHCLRGYGPVRAALWRPGRFDRSEKSLRRAAADLLCTFGLAGKSAELANELSYGQRKRLEIARALGSRPVLLLLDEPGAGLNYEEWCLVRSGLSEYCAHYPFMSSLIVDHRTDFIGEFCSDAVILSRGRVSSQGTMASVMNAQDEDSGPCGSEH